MNKAVIIGAGSFPRSEYPRYLVREADILICCDSAFETFLKVMPSIFGGERLPEAVVGDMDSLSASLQKRYADRMVKVSEQDYNDQTKAMRYLLSMGKPLESVHFIASTGRRMDHSIGNLGLLMEYGRMFSLEGISISAVSDYETVFPLWDSAELAVGEGRRVSIFSPDNSLRIDSEGLEYPTSGVVFDNWWQATLNRAVAPAIRLAFNHPSAALIILS